jgi:hypothetical protein
VSETRMVYGAINRVTAALAAKGIEKSHENKDQKFWFRGIDDVLNALAPLLPEAGLCILPRAVSRDVMPRKTKSGGDTYNVTVKVEYDFVSEKDGSIHTVSSYGEANDTQDKATGKAMSMAYKAACIEAFCIPIKGDDADAGADSAWDGQFADFIAALETAENVDEAKAVYKKGIEACKSHSDAAAAKTLKAKLLDLYPEAAKSKEKVAA